MATSVSAIVIRTLEACTVFAHEVSTSSCVDSNSQTLSDYYIPSALSSMHLSRKVAWHFEKLDANSGPLTLGV